MDGGMVGGRRANGRRIVLQIAPPYLPTRLPTYRKDMAHWDPNLPGHVHRCPPVVARRYPHLDPHLGQGAYQRRRTGLKGVRERQHACHFAPNGT